MKWGIGSVCGSTGWSYRGLIFIETQLQVTSIGPKSVEWCESPKGDVTYCVKRSTITVMSSCCGAPAANAWAP